MTTAAHSAQDPLAINAAAPAQPADKKKDDDGVRTLQLVFKSDNAKAMEAYDKIVKDAADAERKPHDYLRIWVTKNYQSPE